MCQGETVDKVGEDFEGEHADESLLLPEDPVDVVEGQGGPHPLEGAGVLSKAVDSQQH